MKVFPIRALLLALAPLPAFAQTVPTPVVDHARQPVAERIASRLLPPGAFATMMRATMDKMSSGMLDQAMGQMSLADMVKIAGIDEDQAAALGTINLKQVMEIVDPAYAERMRVTVKVMGDEMTAIMAEMEPEYRAGVAEALANHFSLDQLNELDRFFATPVGSAYAAQSMTIYVDPAMLRRMDTIMPRVMKAMPGMMQRVVAATAHLPKVGDPKSLSPEQKRRLSALLEGASESK